MPGRLPRRRPGLARFTSDAAARLASRALAARMIRPTMASAALLLVFSQVSSWVRANPSTADSMSALFSRCLVWPSNSGFRTNTLSTATMPSRMSSAVILNGLAAFLASSCVSM